jgi:hypothetical protein
MRRYEERSAHDSFVRRESLGKLHDLWMAFFTDPDGHQLPLMQDAPKGGAPTK